VTLLDLRGISKSFGSTPVLHGVDFDVRAGEVHALAGENGAGKSTLMNIVSGVLPADSGEILWQGRTVRMRGPRDAREVGIAFVHQELALAPNLSAAENVFLGRHPARPVAAGMGWVRWREIHETAARLFAQLGHAIDPRRPVGELSLAQRQIVEIARALAFDARLIILDEPTAPLSDADAEGLFRAIGHLRERGAGVIYISHRLKEIFRIASRATVMRDGRRVLTEDCAALTADDIVHAMTGGKWGRPSPAVVCPAESKKKVPALSIDGQLTVHFGEIVGLAGLAGAGRTRLLESLFGARKPLAGIRIGGKPVEIRKPLDAIRRGLALIPDDRKGKGLIPGAPVRDNIALAANRQRFFLRGAEETSAAGRFASELRIKLAGLDQPALRLSGGNQQKVVLAKWLNAGARVFLLDEPTRGIDVHSKAEIYELVRRLAREGAAILVASSEVEELLGLADRILVMHRGRITGELPREAATEQGIMRLATGGSN
jgi:ribose transport system ATP-binding protein